MQKMPNDHSRGLVDLKDVLRNTDKIIKYQLSRYPIPAAASVLVKDNVVTSWST